MTLDAWMESARLSNSDLAGKLGKAAETVRRYRSGERDPDLETQRQIFDVSGGLVTPNDWVGVGPRSDAPDDVQHGGVPPCPAP